MQNLHVTEFLANLHNKLLLAGLNFTAPSGLLRTGREACYIFFLPYVANLGCNCRAEDSDETDQESSFDDEDDSWQDADYADEILQHLGYCFVTCRKCLIKFNRLSSQYQSFILCGMSE